MVLNYGKAIKKEVIHKTCYDEKNFLTYGLPDFDDLKQLRSKYNGNTSSPGTKSSIVFYRLFMPCVGNKRNYVNQMHLKKLSEIFTPSQEGYVLIELLNNWEKWNYLAQLEYDTNVCLDSTRNVPSVHFTKSKFHVSMDGWSSDGIVQYNQFCEFARQDRSMDNGKRFEEMFLTMMREHKGIIFGNNVISRTEQFVQPYTDLDDFTGEMESV